MASRNLTLSPPLVLPCAHSRSNNVFPATAFYLPKDSALASASATEQVVTLIGLLQRAGTGFCGGGTGTFQSRLAVRERRFPESQAVRASGLRPLNGAVRWNRTLVTHGLAWRCVRLGLVGEVLGRHVSVRGPSSTLFWVLVCGAIGEEGKGTARLQTVRDFASHQTSGTRLRLASPESLDLH